MRYAGAALATGTKGIVLAFLLVAGVAAQQPQTSLDPNAIMGFESL